MEEAFYSILGVSADADQQSIRRAYREAVKDSHPDVSDDPDASTRFKQLTTARDVLLDSDERARYDRLGHDAYVRRHVETSVWTAETPTGEAAGRTSRSSSGGGSTTTTAGQSTSTTTGRSTAAATGQSSTTATEQSSAASSRSARSTRSARSRHVRDDRSEKTRRQERQRANGPGATTDGGYGASWQQAPDAYMRSDSFAEAAATEQTLLESLRALGPWLVVHIVLLTSAVGTGAFIVASAFATPQMSLPAALFLVVMLGFVIVISTLHLLTEAYA